MEASVVVITYNSAQTLPGLMESLNRQTVAPLEVIVVDGGSSDSTVDIAKEWGCRVLVESDRCRAKARNRGILAARGDVIAFIDSDCRADSRWLESLLKGFETGERIAGVAGRVVAANREKLIPRLIDAAFSERPHYATWNIAYSRRVLVEVGGFDERLHAAEDQALAWKILKRGYKIVWEPRAVVYHLHRETLGAYLKQQHEYGKWAVIAKRLYGKEYSKSLLLPLAWPLLFFKHLAMAKKHPLLPFLLTLSSIAYGLGAWRGALCRLES